MESSRITDNPLIMSYEPLSFDSEPKFAIDENVIKLGRWLRMLGFDAAYYPINSDADLIRIASKEGRIILTRDRHFVERKANCYILENTDPVEQVAEVLTHFGLKPTPAKVLSRCLECNVTVLPVEDKSEIKSVVPPYVYKIHDVFHFCPSCGKVFWEGSHVRQMKAKIRAIFSKYLEVNS